MFRSTNEAYATLVLHEELQHLDKIIYGMYAVWCIEKEVNCFGWYFCLAMGVCVCLKNHNMIKVVAYLDRLWDYPYMCLFSKMKNFLILLKHFYDKKIYKWILNNIIFSHTKNHIFIILLQNTSLLNSFKIPLMQFYAAKKIVFPFEMYFLQRRDRI